MDLIIALILICLIPRIIKFAKSIDEIVHEYAIRRWRRKNALRELTNAQGD